MTPMILPPGFRFHPTDEELVAYYLDRKVNGRSIELEIIPEVDLYKCEPWDLPEKSFLPGNDMEWYFYSTRDKKYPNGSRTNRATKAGYWKTTGKDRAVESKKVKMGMKKTLVYYRGRAPHGLRTNWIMHEYRLIHTTPSSLKESYALCRVFKKNIQIPKRKGEEAEETGEESFCLEKEEEEEVEDEKEKKKYRNIDGNIISVERMELEEEINLKRASASETSSSERILLDEANSSSIFAPHFTSSLLDDDHDHHLFSNYPNHHSHQHLIPYNNPLQLQDFPLNDQLISLNEEEIMSVQQDFQCREYSSMSGTLEEIFSSSATFHL